MMEDAMSAAVAWELARAAKEKFGGDALGDFVEAHASYLERIRWGKSPPAPPLPPEIAAKTSEKYKEAYRALTGRERDGQASGRRPRRHLRLQASVLPA